MNTDPIQNKETLLERLFNHKRYLVEETNPTIIKRLKEPPIDFESFSFKDIPFQDPRIENDIVKATREVVRMIALSEATPNEIRHGIGLLTIGVDMGKEDKNESE